VDGVVAHLEVEGERAARREVVEAALKGARAVLVSDWEQAVEVVNDLAPEHLQLFVSSAGTFYSGIRNAGAIVAGSFTSAPFGDYGVASNHVLPTGGTARFASGLRAADFMKVMSVVEMNDGAARALAPEVALIARSEGLEGHARAVEVRTEERRAKS
jgi:histidinol dehydrogenase